MVGRVGGNSLPPLSPLLTDPNLKPGDKGAPVKQSACWHGVGRRWVENTQDGKKENEPYRHPSGGSLKFCRALGCTLRPE